MITIFTNITYESDHGVPVEVREQLGGGFCLLFFLYLGSWRLNLGCETWYSIFIHRVLLFTSEIFIYFHVGIHMKHYPNVHECWVPVYIKTCG